MFTFKKCSLTFLGLCDEFGEIIVIQDYGGDPDTDSDSFSRYVQLYILLYSYSKTFVITKKLFVANKLYEIRSIGKKILLA